MQDSILLILWGLPSQLHVSKTGQFFGMEVPDAAWECIRAYRNKMEAWVPTCLSNKCQKFLKPLVHIFICALIFWNVFPREATRSSILTGLYVDLTCIPVLPFTLCRSHLSIPSELWKQNLQLVAWPWHSAFLTSKLMICRTIIKLWYYEEWNWPPALCWDNVVAAGQKHNTKCLGKFLMIDLLSCF